MELLPVKEKYDILLKELAQLKCHINSLENEGKNLCDSVRGAKNPIEFRKVYYRALKQYDSYIDRIVEINCNLEIQPFNEPIKNDLQLVMDIPVLPHLAEQKYEMSYIDGDSPWNFWLCHTINRDDFQALQASLREKLSEGLLEPLTSSPVPGDFICFSEGHRICRGIVTHVLKKQRYKILDVDTSAVRIVPYDKLLKIDGEMVAVHWQAMNCFLVESSVDVNLWTGELQRIFSSVLKYNKLMVNVIKRREDIVPSFLVEITAANDFTNGSDDSDDSNSVCNIKEWVCDRILPELRRNASLDKDSRDELSVSALDAFYENCNDHDDEIIDGSDEDNISVTSHSEQLENKLTQVYKKESSENEQDDLLKCERSTLETDNSVNVNELTQVKQEVDVSSSHDYDRPTGNENIVNKHFNESDNCSVKSNSSNSNSVKQFPSIDPAGQDQPEVTATSPSVPCLNNNHTATYSNSSSSLTSATPLSLAPDFNQRQQTFVSHSNIQQVSNMYQLHGPPIIMRPDFAWKNVRYSPPEPFYPQSPPFTYKHNHMIPIQRNVMAIPNPGMHYWNRPVVPPTASSIAHNYTPWSAAANKDVNNSIISSLPSKCFPDPDHSDANVVSSADSVNGQNEVMQSVMPVSLSDYKGYKVELKHQISLIDPEEEISAVISCVLSPDEIYVHLATKNNIDIDSLQSALESYYSVAQHVSLSNKNEGARLYGRYCACYCKIDDIYSDNRFKWYRAEVLNWNEEENEDVVVYLVDYGNKVTVGLSQLQPLAPQFGQHYMMAQRCHISGVKYPEEGWPNSLCKYLKDLLALNEDYSVTVVPAINTVKNSLEVVLFKKNDKSSSINARVKQFMVDELFHRPNGCEEKRNEDQLKNGVCSGADKLNDSKEWDPMVEDYYNEKNNYSVDQDDPCVAVSGYKPKDEERICKFFSKSGRCWKKACKLEHIKNDGLFTTDKEEVYQQAFKKMNLPSRGSFIKLKVTNVLKANTFFAQIQDRRNGESQSIDEDTETLVSLMTALNKSSNVKEFEDANLPLVEGQLVIAKSCMDGRNFWFRARIDEIYDDSSLMVFYVDFGTTDIVNARSIRAVHPKYLHLPFQAVECALANVRVKEKQLDNEETINLLKNVIDNNAFNGIVHESYQESQRLELLLYDSNGCDVADELVDSGFYVYVEKDNDMNDYDCFGEIPG